MHLGLEDRSENEQDNGWGTLAAIVLASGAQAQDARQEGPIEIEKFQTIDKSASYKLVSVPRLHQAATE